MKPKQFKDNKTRQQTVGKEIDQAEHDRFVARALWVVVIVAVGWAATTKDITTFLTTAAIFSIVGPIIAYLVSPVSKKVLIDAARAWRFAIIFSVIVGLGVGLVYGQEAIRSLFFKEIKIGVDLPIDGTGKDNAEAIKRGIELAIKEEGTAQGYKIVVDVQKHYDAESDYNANEGKENIENFINDPKVAGIIGPYHSTVALKEIPVANGDNQTKSRVALIGPSTTADCLTRPFIIYENMHDYTKNYKWQCDNLNNGGAFFRMVAHNSKQGEVYANCLSYPAAGPSDLCPSPDMHRHRNVAVLHDTSNQLYSVDVAMAFAQSWKNKPGNKSAARSVQLYADKDGFKRELTSKLQEIKDELGVEPDLVFFAGEVESAIILHELMKSSNGELRDMSRTAFAGASIMTDEFRDYLLRNKESVSTAPVYDIAPLKNLDTANNETQKGGRDFLRNYYQAYNTTATPYSGTGYAAAKILIKAIRGVGDIPDFNDQTKVKQFREDIIDRIKNPARAEIGPIGEYRFEENGDLTKSAISVFKWNPNNPGNFNGWDYK